MRKLVVYNQEVHAPKGLTVGERVELIRGNGPREGESMCFATITANDGDGLKFCVDGHRESADGE